jgi:UDP-glucose 4-epimerase
MKALLTGGAGYIGSHTAVALLAEGFEVTIVDNLANSSRVAVNRIESLTGRNTVFHEVSLLDASAITAILCDEVPDVVIHFAGLKSVAESVDHPLDYYRTNVAGTLNLLDAMVASGVRSLVFSSSATVYGEPVRLPIDETSPITDAANPYGRTKLHIERMLQDLGAADPDWNIALLRYFNPVGAHESGEIGEDPNGIPNNLLPYVCQFAVGKQDRLVVFGNDYPTPDGTCLRDYVHVTDLASGHLAALRFLNDEKPGVACFNLGTGKASSVIEVIHAFERASGLALPYDIGPRRSGDVPASYTNPDKARLQLGWAAVKTLDDICQDAWRWQCRNPDGYVA